MDRHSKDNDKKPRPRQERGASAGRKPGGKYDRKDAPRDAKGGKPEPKRTERIAKALARAGSPLRLLAEEQIALIEVETGDTEAAIARFQSILADAEVTAGLRQRVSQVIVALGGELDAA